MVGLTKHHFQEDGETQISSAQLNATQVTSSDNIKLHVANQPNIDTHSSVILQEFFFFLTWGLQSCEAAVLECDLKIIKIWILKF